MTKKEKITPKNLPQKQFFKPDQLVYTIRNLNLADIKMVGFDMDYTLAVYQKKNMEELQYKMTVEEMVTKLAYPKQIKKLKYDEKFAIRGLVLDKQMGYLLKVDAYGQVHKVLHGKKILKTSTINKLYQNKKIKLGAQRFISVDTLFAMPEVCLYANLVEFFNDNPSLIPAKLQKAQNDQQVDYCVLYDHIRQSLDEIHANNSLKSIIVKNLSKYIIKNKTTAFMLDELSSSGKKIFLLTNSHWDYTNAVMSYLLNDVIKNRHWQSYFELIIVGSKKPGFFIKRDPFIEIATERSKKNNPLVVNSSNIFKLKVLQGGNIVDFEKSTKCRGVNILYIGDHIYGDILISKKDSLWRTCLIVEELEAEISSYVKNISYVEKLKLLDRKWFACDNSIREKKALIIQLKAMSNINSDLNSIKGLKTINKMIVDANKEVQSQRIKLQKINKQIVATQKKLESSAHPIFGSLFKEHGELSQFAHQINAFACIYTSNIANLLLYDMNHHFKAKIGKMSHDYALANLSTKN